MTKEDALKQFEESEKVAQDKKKFKQIIKEHATDEEMLAQDDEADTFHSFGSMAIRHWKSIKTFSKLGCVQDIFNFYTSDDLFSLKNEFLDMFYKQTCQFKINFSFAFILRNCSGIVFDIGMRLLVLTVF